uniref:Uncharacterized protein n=1 Tax=Arundo donax TaxID=35708 RepID=A0A0A9H7E8_ARUDO
MNSPVRSWKVWCFQDSSWKENIPWDLWHLHQIIYFLNLFIFSILINCLQV